MTSDPLHERGQALENLFFQERDKQLLEQLREKLAVKDAREALAEVSGVEDPAVLDDLIANGVRAETLCSVSLIPLIAVAWADGKLDPPEKDAIMRAAAESGIDEGHPGRQLLDNWLIKQPGDELFAVWKSYVDQLADVLDDQAYTRLRETVLKRATEVARAAGGFLGIGSISYDEKQVIEAIRQRLEK